MNPLETEAVKNPLQHIGEWEEFVVQHYPEPTGPADTGKPAVGYAPEKKETEFRNYEADARPTVREFYRLNHTYQTYEFGQAKRKEYLGLNRMTMGVWEAAEYLNQLVDDSDPDTDMTQLQHLLQTAEHLRRDGQPRWMVLTGFVHDLGKILCLWGEPQWAVVGDTFATGCAYSPKIFPEVLRGQSRQQRPALQHAQRHLRARMRIGQGFAVVGARRVHLPRLPRLPARGGLGHAAVPQLLSLAPGVGVLAPDQ